MRTFKTNIIAIYGEHGKAWLNTLSARVVALSEKFGLVDLTPLKNLTHHYVLSGLQRNRPVMLKLGLDKTSLNREARALRSFEGYGSIQLIAVEPDALLMERATPGDALSNDTCSLATACNVMKRLQEAPIPHGTGFPHVEDWLKVLDQEWDLPPPYLNKARQLRDRLAAAYPDEHRLLHGDLHRGNILQNGQEWIVIDPKGVIGHPLHETGAFVIDAEQDTQIIAHYFGFDLQDVRDCYFVHTMMAACWCLEDHMDPRLFLEQAEKVFHMI